MQQEGQRDQQKGLSLGPKALGARSDLNPESPLPRHGLISASHGVEGSYPHGVPIPY